MWFLYSVIALLCWSGSDLFSKIGSKPDDKFSHWKMVMSVGLVMGLHAAYEIFIGKTPINMDVIIKYLPASLCYILSMLLGYVGLRYIELSVSSPICNSSGALVVILCFIFIPSERDLSIYQIIGVVCICLGVIGLGIVEAKEDEKAKEIRRESQKVSYKKTFLALLFPLLYMVLDAAGTFADSIILDSLNEESANVAYELTFLLMAVVSAVYVLSKKEGRKSFTVKREGPKLIGAVCETAGQFAYVFALGAKPILAAPVISAYCVASVIWSRIFLKEKLSAKHYATICLTVIGIVALGICDGLDP